MPAVPDQHDPMPEFVQPAQTLEKLFYEDQLLLFQKRTRVFMQQSFPGLAATLTELEMEKLAIAVMKQAERWNYMTEREIWYYLIMIVYCGFFFDTDPQYTDFLRAIGWGTQAASRSEEINTLLDKMDEFYTACERDFETFDKKLKYIAQFYMNWNYDKPLGDDMRVAMTEKVVQAIFPVRWNLLASETRYLVLSGNLEHADNLGLSVKDGIIYTLAAIYFGQAFEQSPVYPWAHFLGDTKIAAAARARQFIEAAQNHFRKLVL